MDEKQVDQRLGDRPPKSDTEDVKKDAAELREQLKERARKKAKEQKKGEKKAQNLELLEGEGNSETPPKGPEDIQELVQAARDEILENDNSSDAADALLSLRAKSTLEVKAKIDEDFNLKHAWAMLCRRCNGLGMFFSSDPRGRAVPDTEWYTAYRKQSEPHYEQSIWCQCCHKVGLRIPMLLKRSPIEGGWRIASAHSRYVCAINRETGAMLITSKESGSMVEPETTHA